MNAKKMNRRDFEKSIRKHAKKYFDITLTKHQMRWLKFIYYSGPRCMLLGPRRHGKSVAVNTVFLSWSLCRDPTLRILIISHKDQRAKDFSRRLRTAIDNPDMKEDYGYERGFSWQVAYWQITSTKKNRLEYPTVETVGIGGGVAGGSYDWLIFEDLCTEQNSLNEDSRDEMKLWLDDVFNTQDSGPRMKVIFLGTRQHINDYYSELLRNPDYDCMVSKAIQDDGTPLWPERYPIDELEARKRRKPTNFSYEWQQEPVPIEGSSFKREWLEKTGVFYEHLPSGAVLDYYMGVDVSAGSLEKRSTYFAYAVAAYDAVSDKIFIVDMFRGKLSIEQQKAKIREIYWLYHKERGLKQCIIEAPMLYAKLYEDVLQELPRARKYSPMHDDLGGARLIDKIMRIETILCPLFEQGRISLKNPSVDFYSKEYIDNEYILFPKGDFDMSDALVYAVADATQEKELDSIPFWFPGMRNS